MKQNTAKWSQCVNGTEHSEMEPMCKSNRTQRNGGNVQMEQNTLKWSQCVNETEHIEMEPMCKLNRTQRNGANV